MLMSHQLAEILMQGDNCLVVFEDNELGVEIIKSTQRVHAHVYEVEGETFVDEDLSGDPKDGYTEVVKLSQYR